MRYKSTHRWRFIELGLALIFIIYAITTYHFANRNRFLPNTQIGATNVSNKTVNQAATAINRTLSQQKFSLTQNGKTLATFSTQKLGVHLQSTTALAKLMQQQNAWSWPLRFFGNAQADTKTKLAISSDKAALTSIIAEKTTALNKTRQAGSAGKLQIKNDKVTLQNGTAGNQISAAKLTNAVTAALASGDTSLAVTKTVYTTPSTNTQTHQLAKKATAILNERAAYNVGGTHFTIPKQKIASWLVYQNGTLTLNQNLVQAYVTALNHKYRTYGKTKTFKSTLRGTVSVSGGLYGWSFRVADETAALTAQILKGKSFTRQPLVQGTGYNTNKQVIGNTYVEVDKQNQKMFIYVNGKLKLKTNVVTGLPPKQTTTTGVWSVWAKKRNATLKGTELDGTKYATKVSYWMPIDDTGIGIHDASWQPTFGGTWYKTHGSNGCINTPPSVMPKVYKLVALGTPVIVF
ncbi:L,D-transpeptidase family protein [Pediococcus siamensis]|uniref:L,D-transpeptidase family protein n=1 Tax=Pediococcus siamensis TaxID=381829 RepID=UPI0039A136F5